MEVYHSFKLSMVGRVLLSSLKQVMVNNNVEVCGNPNLKWSMKKCLAVLLYLALKNTICGFLTCILKAIDLA